MAIQYGAPSNYQQIAAQGQQIVLELRKMQEEAARQKAAQLTALIQNSSAQNAQAMQTAAQMQFRRQEREAEAQQQMQIERERTSAYKERLEQEWQYRAEAEKQQALAKYGYFGPAAEQQFASDLEASGLSSREFATVLESNRRQREALDKDAIESLGMPYVAAVQRAQSFGLDYPTLKNIAADRDPNRGYGVSPTSKATIQRLEAAYSDMADDPEFQDADGMAMMGELRQKINAMYQPTVFFREKPQTIAQMIGADKIDPRSGVRWEQTGDNAGRLIAPDGSYSLLYATPNRTTGQLEIHEATSWDAPKPDESGAPFWQQDPYKIVQSGLAYIAKDQGNVVHGTVEESAQNWRKSIAAVEGIRTQQSGTPAQPQPAPAQQAQQEALNVPPWPADARMAKPGQNYLVKNKDGEIWIVQYRPAQNQPLVGIKRVQ